MELWEENIVGNEIHEQVRQQFGEVGSSSPAVAQRALEKIGGRRTEAEALRERTRDVMIMASQIANAGDWQEEGCFKGNSYEFRGTDFIPADEELSVALRQDSRSSNNRRGLVTCLFVKRDEEIDKVGDFISGGEIDLTGVGSPTLAELSALEELFTWMVQNRSK